ncbi:hypothetical protein EVAR_101725_1 [Eumeta japonica]|uniref:Uncharacterized protein n=1 Tax=Eumeta variegata TaxID=151549 RepID=A0A4C1T335_EUMVA|nr:hypothetical protein EVAR_101725_1 [Eumeta japonica]
MQNLSVISSSMPWEVMPCNISIFCFPGNRSVEGVRSRQLNSGKQNLVLWHGSKWRRDTEERKAFTDDNTGNIKGQQLQQPTKQQDHLKQLNLMCF